MTLTQALLAAVAAETATIVFLFGILLKKNASQDERMVAQEERLDDCEKDRDRLNRVNLNQQQEITDIWKQLYIAGISPKRHKDTTT